MATIPRLKINYYEENRSPDVIVCGQWEYILAERKFGVGAMQAGNVDALCYAAFNGGRRAGIVPEGMGYDAWAQTVVEVEEDGEGESLAPPAT